jgi:hypothetical protein
MVQKEKGWVVDCLVSPCSWQDVFFLGGLVCAACGVSSTTVKPFRRIVASLFPSFLIVICRLVCIGSSEVYRLRGGLQVALMSICYSRKED